jgi:hypothetical protein
MRFGSHSHPAEKSDPVDSKLGRERDRVVSLLRGMADRIERANQTRLSGSLGGITTAAEDFVRMVERALGR